MSKFKIQIPERVIKLMDKLCGMQSKQFRSLMERLWIHWTHLGVDEDTKDKNLHKLLNIEADLHRDVISETEQKIESLEGQVEKLKEETEQLSKYLSLEISVKDYKDDMVLAEYKKELEDHIAGYREQLEQRRNKMERLVEWQRYLTDRLGVAIQELQDVPLPSEDELDRLREHLEVLQAERDKRAEIFLNVQLDIKDIMDKLHIKPQNNFEHMVVTNLSVDFKYTDLNMERLAKLQQDLHEQYEQTNNRVLELRERLAKLWDCLEEDQIYRDNFLHAHPGCHPDTENAIKEEIKRCEQIKKQKIQVFVANIRTKIKLMWDNIMYSIQEREEFIHYFQDIFTEDTLTLHELYLDKITKFYNDNKQIFDLVLNRRNLWLKMTELEGRATEPGRYHNRGGQLLKEEKERKAIGNKLPKIEDQIILLVTQYEAKTGLTFTVDGKPLIKMMEEEWETRKAERHCKITSARKQALTPTPLLRSLATSPLGKRNRTAAGLVATAEKNKPPTKRQLITGSANKAVSANSNNVSALKRSAISTVKRRISNRLQARALPDGESAKRRLDYGSDFKKTPIKFAVSGSILNYKRTPQNRRRSSGRRSLCSKSNATSTSSQEQNVKQEQNLKQEQKDPLMETTLLTTYTDFKDALDENKVVRSSLAVKDQQAGPKIVIQAVTPQKTPRKGPMTPKIGKENIRHCTTPVTTPKNLPSTSRVTRSALNNDGFATPRAPLSGSRANLQRQNTDNCLNVKTTPNNVSRSKSQTHFGRTNLPPLM